MTRPLLGLLVAVTVHAADFFTGQAARAVLGQPSFSAREAGIVPSAMTISGGKLNVADESGVVSVFDLSSIPSARAEVPGRGSDACALCGFRPAATVSQLVAPGSSTFSMFGNRMAAIDTRTHQVLIWRDLTAPSASFGPDVVLNLSDPGVLAVSDSTIIDPISVAIDDTRLFVGDGALHRVLVWKTLPTSPNQPADSVLGQSDFNSRETSDTPRANSVWSPNALVSNGIDLFVGDSHDRRVLVFSPADTPLSPDSILNSASLATGQFAPGTLVTVRGSQLAFDQAAAPDERLARLPTKLAGTELYLNGVAIPLLSVSPAEIRAQLPYTVSAATFGSIYVRSESPEGSVAVSAAASVAFSAASPGIFAFDGPEPRPGIVLHAGENGEGGSPVTADAPAASSEVVTLWVAGLHPIASSNDLMPSAGVPSSGSDLAFAPIHAVVNGQPAEVVGASLPHTSIGVYQVQVLLPSSTTRETAELSISEDGVNSNTVTFASQRP